MFGVRPENLSTDELIRYAWLHIDKLPPEWLEEILKRLEESVDSDDGK